MHYLNRPLSLILFLVCWACSRDTGTEKYQNRRDNIVYAGEHIKEIVLPDFLISNNIRLCTLRDYLIVSDYRIEGKQIHLFDKDNYTYLTSFGDRGQGPDEITNMGHIATNDTENIVYVSDHGKQTIFAYQLDSVLADTLYKPQVRMKMSEKQFPHTYQYINDTTCIGLIIAPNGNSDYRPSVAKWNMNTGEVLLMPYNHPDIEKKRICFAVSTQDSIYVECYANCDLMTICQLDGRLRCNVYGSNWHHAGADRLQHYTKAIICKKHIIAAYSGNDRSGDGYYPTHFLLFDTEGNYKKTLEIGYPIVDFCYDKENDRIIMALNDEMQLVYFDVNDFI